MTARASYLRAVDQGDLDAVPIWAGEAIDLVTELVPAADLVEQLAAATEAASLKAARAIS